jgi:hypothetical protein
MARSGDTKSLCHIAHVSVALPRVSLWPLSGDTSLVLCQDARAKASQALMRHAWGDRAYPEACGTVLASPACRAVPARHGAMLLSGRHAADSVASPAAEFCSRMQWPCGACA